MNPSFAYATVGASDTYVFVAAAKTTLSVSFEVGEGNKAIIILQMATHTHALEPFPAVHGQGNGILFVQYIHRGKSPSIHFQCFSVLGSGVAVTLVVGICFYDRSTFKVFGHQSFDPFARDDVGAVFLTCVKFYTHFAFYFTVHLFVGFDKSVGREVAGKINNGGVASALVHGHIVVAASAGYGFLVHSVGCFILLCVSATSCED